MCLLCWLPPLWPGTPPCPPGNAPPVGRYPPHLHNYSQAGVGGLLLYFNFGIVLGNFFFNVGHTSVGNFDSVLIDNFPQGVVLGETFVN